MPKLLPPNLSEAVTFGLDLLDDSSKRELALVGYVDPHTKYSTDFIRVIGKGLGIFDSSNQSLILDLAENHNEGLHFLELGPEGASREGTVRMVLAAMVERLRGETPSSYLKKLAVILVDPPDDEAPSVTLRSERGEVVAFCYPCGLKVGDLIANRLSVLDADVRAATRRRMSVFGARSPLWDASRSVAYGPIPSSTIGRERPRPVIRNTHAMRQWMI